MTEEQIAQAAADAYRAANHPPMPDDLVAKVGALLAPLDEPAGGNRRDDRDRAA